MSSSANPQHEPTMEEILASIRKIISEDQQPEPARPAPMPAPVKAQPAPEPEPIAIRAAAPVAAPPPPPAAELDVLELTEEVTDDEPLEPPASRAPLLENDIAFENIAPPPREEPAMDVDLISDSTRHAVGRAFANLNGEKSEFAPRSGSGGIEAIFVRAVQDAFQPTLQHWIDGHSTDIMDNLKPLIRAWMNEHLPALIEAAVVKEIARSAENARKR
jgi:cell pole-organizing protein PopZ